MTEPCANGFSLFLLKKILGGDRGRLKSKYRLKLSNVGIVRYWHWKYLKFSFEIFVCQNAIKARFEPLRLKCCGWINAMFLYGGFFSWGNFSINMKLSLYLIPYTIIPYIATIMKETQLKLSNICLIFFIEFSFRYFFSLFEMFFLSFFIYSYMSLASLKL